MSQKLENKIEKKSPFQEEKEGLKRHKAWIDEKYRDLEEILSPKSAISKSFSGRIQKNLEDVNEDRRK